jgi:hypothetical protein
VVTYLVQISIDPDIADEWTAWMKGTHIPDVMNTGVFLSSSICRCVDPAESDGRLNFAVVYECDSLEQLEEYRKTVAPGIQAQHTQRYAGRFSAKRAVLVPLE